jgi:hypothetical protein
VDAHALEEDKQMAKKRREPGECYDPALLADDEDWERIIEPYFCEHPEAADAMARMLAKIRAAILSGPEGTERAIYTLSDGVRICFKYTKAHRAALRLYDLNLEADCLVDEELLQVVRTAIRSINRRKEKKANG